MRTILLFISSAITIAVYAQSHPIPALQKAVKALVDDPQLAHASIGLYVTDAATGKAVYQHNGQLGLSPASCQKIITAVSALEILGPGWRYKTALGYKGRVVDGVLNGDLVLQASGDPSLGSWRWAGTSRMQVLKIIASGLQQRGIKKITGNIYIDDRIVSYQPIPDGWTWQDIGNYFGAGAWGLNWHENQYDVHLSSGEEGTLTKILYTAPFRFTPGIHNMIRAGKKGSGDNAYLYAAPYSELIYSTGTIGAHEKDFTISGSVPDPAKAFYLDLDSSLKKQGIEINGSGQSYNRSTNQADFPLPEQKILTIESPSLDSLAYWFLKKSINLYGEALVKTIAATTDRAATTEEGIGLIRDFWKTKGISSAALKMQDGSGLSPSNRITAQSLVTVLQYARTRPWFPAFYNAMPIIHGIRMKDGYIGGVRSFTGYIKNKAGREYCFAIIVNNYDGSTSALNEKLWKLLDILN
jgi:serine-type D-Ala-D-Ala carboxypeptidase/endopeptidase (penicillin-binding protein 4)